MPDLHLAHASTLAANGASAAEIRPILEQAIAVSRAQSARCPELRAATALAHTLEASDAIALLDALCSNFTEGADLIDLMEAKGLLASLHRSRALNSSKPKGHEPWQR